jgi:Ca2+/H+ antiporter, TMEM165/GDT1 family
LDAALLAFAVVFVAELGDKTQLVALGLAARYKLSLVLVGVLSAYAITQGIAAIVGGVLGAALPTRAIGLGSAVIFVGFGIWTLRERSDADEVDEEVEEELAEEISEIEARAAHSSRRSLGIVMGIVGAMVVAELGDKSAIATATIAADRGALGAWIGATLGISASGAIAVVIGRVLGARVSPRTTQLVSGGLFILFGVLLLAETLR